MTETDPTPSSGVSAEGSRAGAAVGKVKFKYDNNIYPVRRAGLVTF